jgi:hypothetical protein
MDSMDTNLAMSLLDSGDETEQEGDSMNESSGDETDEKPVDDDDPWA